MSAERPCPDCAHRAFHAPTCRQARALPVRAIAREMERLEARAALLRRLAAELRGIGEVSCIIGARLLDRDARLIKQTWCDWAELVVGKPWLEMHPADIRALAARVTNEQRLAAL